MIRFGMVLKIETVKKKNGPIFNFFRSKLESDF